MLETNKFSFKHDETFIGAWKMYIVNQSCCSIYIKPMLKGGFFV